VRSLIGVTGQYASVDENLTATENLLLFGRLQGLSRGDSRRRAGHLLEQFDLTEAATKPISAFSGDMRRRLDLAASLITRPPLIFLDEPTTGLDPRSRIDLWSVISELVADGTTVLLTTQYLEEADRLADDIVVLDHGRTVAQGTPESRRLAVPLDRSDQAVDILVALREPGIGIESLTVQKPSLDEVFMALTGHGAEDESATTTQPELEAAS
jgi:ABC-2 type transport system ATP-binding protein